MACSMKDLDKLLILMKAFCEPGKRRDSIKIRHRQIRSLGDDYFNHLVNILGLREDLDYITKTHTPCDIDDPRVFIVIDYRDRFNLDCPVCGISVWLSPLRNFDAFRQEPGTLFEYSSTQLRLVSGPGLRLSTDSTVRRFIDISPYKQINYKGEGFEHNGEHLFCSYVDIVCMSVSRLDFVTFHRDCYKRVISDILSPPWGGHPVRVGGHKARVRFKPQVF